MDFTAASRGGSQRCQWALDFTATCKSRAFFSFVSIHAQDIRRLDPSFEDYLPLLKSTGYEVFNFDISSLKDSTYKISDVTKEYVNGVLVHDSSKDKYQFYITNRDMLSDLTEDQKMKILAENSAYDAENDILRLAKKIAIGFIPAADSLKSTV